MWSRRWLLWIRRRTARWFPDASFFKVFDEHQMEYVLLAYGDSDDVYMVGKIASFQIQNLLIAYKERFDKDNFIKNLLLDNLLLVDHL